MLRYNLFKSNQKIFCIGFNKTGTTTFERIMIDHDIKMGNQKSGELLFFEYAKRNFKPIINFCKTAQAFQDIPFSLPFTYVALHQAYPNSKFILTVRDDEHIWYDSLIRFLSKLYEIDSKPTVEDVRNYHYRTPNYMYTVGKYLYKTPDEDFFNEKALKDLYLTHNKNVIDYFRDNKNFIVINFAKKGDFQRLCDFLAIDPKYNTPPWENKSIPNK